MQRQVSVNARFLIQPLTGIQRYAYNICVRIPELRLITPDAPLPQYTRISPTRTVVVKSVFPSHLWEQIVLPRHVPKNELLWSPSSIGPIASKKYVLTVHDIASIEHPEWYDSKYAIFYRILLPISLKRAKHVITVSKFCKKRLETVFNIKPEKISVVYSGVAEHFLSGKSVNPCSEEYNLPETYVLAVGALSPRKNLHRLLQAWASISHEFNNTWLIIAGDVGLSFSNMTTLGELPSRTIHIKKVSDTLLGSLYRNATAFVYPSLYEGFGLPILEAMACGTPVITSNCTSMPEIAGDAALLVNPYDVSSIASAIQQLLRDSALRERLRSLGIAHAAKFSWENTSLQTKTILERFS